MSDPARKAEKARKQAEKTECYATYMQVYADHGVHFVKFPKIPRLNRDIVITEKIDGTNAAIQITPHNVEALEYGSNHPDDFGFVIAQSRTRIITPDNDNAGFARWVEDNMGPLREVLGPGVHYGEWWGQGIQRGYKQTRKWFSLFNYNRWSNDPSVASLATIGVQVIPILYRGPWMAVVGGKDTVDVYPHRDYEGKITPGILRFAPDVVLQQLEKRGSVAAQVNGVLYKKDHESGDKGPEGIVVFHEAGRVLFKATIENDETPKAIIEAREEAVHQSFVREIEQEGF